VWGMGRSDIGRRNKKGKRHGGKNPGIGLVLWGHRRVGLECRSDSEVRCGTPNPFMTDTVIGFVVGTDGVGGPAGPASFRTPPHLARSSAGFPMITTIWMQSFPRARRLRRLRGPALLRAVAGWCLNPREKVCRKLASVPGETRTGAYECDA